MGSSASPGSEPKGEAALRRMLVGFDGSQGGRDALALARSLGSLSGASALVVVSVLPHGPLPSDYAVLEAEGDAEPLFAEARERLAGLGVETHGSLRLISVAYDGSPESKAALKRAEALAPASGAALRLLTVVSHPWTASGFTGYTPATPPRGEEILRDGVDSVDPALAAEGHQLEGATARALAEACEDGVDLLLAGSRGYGPLAQVLLGSVSKPLIHLAPCPVLVVPRP